MFEKASRLKLRFLTKKGPINVEDLWEMKLEELDELAKSLRKQVSASEEESFIKKRTSADKVAELQFEIVKHVIVTRLAEEEAKADAKLRIARRKEILEILGRKEKDALESKSVEELKAELASLE